MQNLIAQWTTRFAIVCSFLVLASLSLAQDVASITTDATNYVGGTSTTHSGTVTLTAAAVGDTDVLITSDSGAPSGFPQNVTVLDGNTTANFTFQTDNVVSTLTTVNLTADAGGATAGCSFTVSALKVRRFVVSDTKKLAQGTMYSGYVKLNASPAVNQTVNLSSNNGGVTFSDNAPVVLAGTDTVNFSVFVDSACGTGPTNLAADFNSATEVRTVSIVPLSMTSFTLSAASVTGGGSVQGTITLNGTVQADTHIGIVCAKAFVTLPGATVTVTAGSNQISFAINTSTVTSIKLAKISAALGAQTKNVLLTVNP